MDSVKTDNEGELTSTMDNVISVPSKAEKSDTSSDATPTSSTDANICPAASRIALDDPISSTSSDSLDQIKLKMDKGDSASVEVHRVSTDNEADLLDITNITNNEKITEDVEDLVHDLESLLGESTDSFNITSNSKFARKDTSVRSASGHSSNDASCPIEDTTVAVDEVLQELEELAGNVTTDKPSTSIEKNTKNSSVADTLTVESSDATLEVDSERNISGISEENSDNDLISRVDNSNSVEEIPTGSSIVAVNSEILSVEDTVDKENVINEPENIVDVITEESSLNNQDANSPEILCIQDQDISHSEPKDIQMEKAESTTVFDVSQEQSENLPSKTEAVVTSSNGDPTETSQVSKEICSSVSVKEKSDVTGSEEVKNVSESEYIDSRESFDEKLDTIDNKKTQDIAEHSDLVEGGNMRKSMDLIEGSEKSRVDEVEGCENNDETAEVSTDMLSNQLENVNEECKNDEIVDVGIKGIEDTHVDRKVSDVICTESENSDTKNINDGLQEDESTNQEGESKMSIAPFAEKLQECATDVEMIVDHKNSDDDDMVESTLANIKDSTCTNEVDDGIESTVTFDEDNASTTKNVTKTVLVADIIDEESSKVDPTLSEIAEDASKASIVESTISANVSNDVTSTKDCERTEKTETEPDSVDLVDEHSETTESDNKCDYMSKPEDDISSKCITLDCSMSESVVPSEIFNKTDQTKDITNETTEEQSIKSPSCMKLAEEMVELVNPEVGEYINQKEMATAPETEPISSNSTNSPVEEQESTTVSNLENGKSKVVPLQESHDSHLKTKKVTQNELTEVLLEEPKLESIQRTEKLISHTSDSETSIEKKLECDNLTPVSNVDFESLPPSCSSTETTTKCEDMKPGFVNEEHDNNDAVSETLVHITTEPSHNTKDFVKGTLTETKELKTMLEGTSTIDIAENIEILGTKVDETIIKGDETNEKVLPERVLESHGSTKNLEYQLTNKNANCIDEVTDKIPPTEEYIEDIPEIVLENSSVENEFSIRIKGSEETNKKEMEICKAAVKSTEIPKIKVDFHKPVEELTEVEMKDSSVCNQKLSEENELKDLPFSRSDQEMTKPSREGSEIVTVPTLALGLDENSENSKFHNANDEVEDEKTCEVERMETELESKQSLKSETGEQVDKGGGVNEVADSEREVVSASSDKSDLLLQLLEYPSSAVGSSTPMMVATSFEIPNNSEDLCEEKSEPIFQEIMNLSEPEELDVIPGMIPVEAIPSKRPEKGVKLLKSDELAGKNSSSQSCVSKEVYTAQSPTASVESDSQPEKTIGSVPEVIQTNEAKGSEVVEQDETALAVASLENIDMDNNAPLLTEKDKQEMEALRQAVESITDANDEIVKKIDDEEQNILLVSAASEDSTSSEVVEAAVIDEDDNECHISVAAIVDEGKSAAVLDISKTTEVTKVTVTSKAEVTEICESLEMNDISEDSEFIGPSEAVELSKISGNVEVNKVSAETKTIEAHEVNKTSEDVEMNETFESVEANETFESRELNDTSEALEVNDTSEDLEVKETSEAVEVNESSKPQEVNEVCEPLEVNEAPEAVDISENVEVTGTSEAVEVTKTSEIVEVAETCGVVEVTETSDFVEMKKTSEAVEVVASLDIVEVSEADTKNENELLASREANAEVSNIKNYHPVTEACSIVENDEANEEVLPDSSQSISDNEIVELVKNDHEKDNKNKINDRSRRHKKSSDNKVEELNINVDVPEKEKSYSPKITIKPIKVPDEEVSTTSNSETEAGKGSLKMTITKQSDKMHSILKVCDAEHSPEPDQEQEELLPKLKIKSKPTEQQLQKMSTRSSRQLHQASIATQRSSSPRITIKPVVKPEAVSPLKIKIGLKTDETTKKHSPKLSIKALPKQEDEPKEMTQSPRKVLIKPIVKPAEEEEQTPKITIKPIPKPELEKETSPVSTKLNIKPIKKPEEEENDSEKVSPKITIKPILKPPEPDSHSDEFEDETKKRIVLKINKGNLPAKESRKREHPPEDDKAEKLAKITVKFSKEGGHPHIVQQPDENLQKRPHEEQNYLEKNKKQKLDIDSAASTRSKPKDVPVESETETKINNPAEPPSENIDNPKSKQHISDNPGHGFRGKHKDPSSNSPIEAKRTKLREMKQKDSPETKKSEADAIQAVVASPIGTSEDTSSSSTVHNNPGPEVSPASTKDVVSSIPTPETSTPTSTLQPKKRGRPRKIPQELRPDGKPLDSPSQPKTLGTPPTSTTTESGRPKRSCRGQSALDTLGLKPRKPRANKGGRGGAKAAAGESRAIPMKPEKEPKLSQAKLKLMQKAISEAGIVTVVSVGTGEDKSVDIEDVLPQCQVEKKKHSEEIFRGLYKNPHSHSFVDKKNIVPIGASDDIIFKTTEEYVDSIEKKVPQSSIKSADRKSLETSRTELKDTKIFYTHKEFPAQSEITIKGSDDNEDELVELKLEKPDIVTFEGKILEVKKEIVEKVQSKSNQLKIHSPKFHSVDAHPSTSIGLGLPSSSTSPSHQSSEAMLVTDPVPQDASMPKSFGAGEDSSLLAPESSCILQSSVSSTTGPSEIVMVDEETRMSADTSSRAQTPAKQVVPMDIVEESQSSATTESGKASSSRSIKAPRPEVQEPEGSVISLDQLAEYCWNGNGPFMLQEQVAHFLGIKSFKRKYPGIKRRMLEMQERDFIRESGLVSEHMCDLGLTAVNSADILDIMYSDFQEKYEEYCKHQRDRQAKELINKQKALSLAASQEKNKADLTENAKQSAAQWNANFNKMRREQRRACMDLQTYTVHYPKGRMKQFSKPKSGNYPVALVPGQFTDYYKEFTPTEINNLPLNTMCYEAIDYIRPDDSTDSGSDGSDSDSDSSSSSSGSDSNSSSGVEDCNLCKQSPKKVTSAATK